MLINCPKCHFRQPQDQYCASCGIDMIAFKPIPISRSKTFFQSGFFQIFFLILIAAVVAYFIAQSDHPQSWVRKFSYAKKTNSSTTELSSQKSAVNESLDTDAPTEVQVVALSNDSTLNQFAHPNSQDSSKEIGSTAEIKLTYAEVSRETLNLWSIESQKLGLYQSYIDFSAGILPNYKSNQSVNFKDLKSETKKIALKKTEALLSGKTFSETSEFLGLQTNIAYNAFEDQTTKGHLTITKISKSGKVNLPIEFELQKGALFFVNWKTAMVGFETETSLFQIPPFQIMQSPNFLNQKTEFIILIEPL